MTDDERKQAQERVQATVAPPGPSYTWLPDQVSALKVGALLWHVVNVAASHSLPAFVIVEALELPTPVRVVGFGKEDYHHLIVKWPFSGYRVQTYLELCSPQGRPTSEMRI